MNNFSFWLKKERNGDLSSQNKPMIDSLTVKKHLYTLASDEMQGRRAGTPGIEKAAKYIEGEFKRIGLKTYGDLDSEGSTFSSVLLTYTSVFSAAFYGASFFY